jgi:serine/threonine protein kinase
MTERDIFLAALAWDDPARRAAYLDAACAGDPALRRRVEDLLRAHGPDPRALDERAGGASSAGGGAELTRGGDETPGGEPIGLGFLEPSDDPESLGRLGHYDVRQVLGRGGFGVVLKAFDRKLHRTVAVKVLAPYLAASSAARQRFLREARAAAAVRHEHVVDIHAVEDVPVPYLVMEHVAGETLQRRLDRAGPLPLAEVLRVGAQAARGLAAAHDKGLVHRDIKPANILLSLVPGPSSLADNQGQGTRDKGQGTVKITDFGLARAGDDASLTRSGYVTGTPLYMAPEQALGEAVDHRADLFSLGSTLYAACTGQPPFRAGTSLGVLKRVVEDEPRHIRDLNPTVPDRLCDIIARLQAKRPDDRFQTAAEVADLLERYLAEVEAPTTAAPEPPPAEPAFEEKAPPAGWSRRRSRWIVVATAAAALVAGLAITEAAGVVPVARTVARLFASAPAVANDNRAADLPAAVAPPQAALDRPEPPRPPDGVGKAPAPAEPPPLALLPPPEVTVKQRTPFDLPEPFEDVKTGAGGRLLVFKLKKQFAVFDVCTGQLRYADLPADDVRFTAGRHKLLVVLQGQKLIQRWDLGTLQVEKVVPVPDGANVETVAMGSDSGGPLALWAGGQVKLMDVEQLKPLDINTLDLRATLQQGYELRASADGRTFVGWVSRHSPSKFTLLSLAGQQAFQAAADGGSYRDRWAMPSADGGLVLRSDHRATDGALNPYLADSLSDRVLLPSADPRFFLAAHGQEVTVCTSCDRRPVFTVSDKALAGLDSDPVTTHWFLVRHDEPRVRYLPDAHLLVFLPEGNRQVVVRPFNLIDELNKSGQEYLFVTSLPKTRARAGAPYTYQMEVQSRAGGVTFKLHNGPAGMTVSDQGELRWDVPPGEAGKSESVIVEVRNAAGKPVTHSFQLAVE